ncbi:hypothetical protein SAY87_025363 [Trapa incisa]|uniref:Calcium uniporter protein C-terminal domain-containing protein n=1 Tax=Trapa incisa TaxID=236973 RepID=A0AAN7JGH1_9MYRT|nr:hypothetical protein SAY87_025363 [Trapa incisa]
MAMKKALGQRLLDVSKITREAVAGRCRAISGVDSTGRVVSRSQRSVDHDPGDDGLFRRFLHKRALLSPSPSPDPRLLPHGEGLREKLRVLDIAGTRIHLDCLIPPPAVSIDDKPEVRVEDVGKLLRAVQLQAIRERLWEIRESWIPFLEFVRLCGEACSDADQGAELAKVLSESGDVVVFGKMVLLKPDAVMKAVAGLIPLPEPSRDDPRRKELEEMEATAAEIEGAAEAHVRRELWVGLGFLMVQTAGFMRLTFWELSWDVMEPICFYVTSFYFMVGYAFFLQTSREPSFEGFFQSRVEARRRRLMRSRGFDLERFEELRRAFRPRTGLPLAGWRTAHFGPIETRG